MYAFLYFVYRYIELDRVKSLLCLFVLSKFNYSFKLQRNNGANAIIINIAEKVSSFILLNLSKKLLIVREWKSQQILIGVQSTSLIILKQGLLTISRDIGKGYFPIDLSITSININRGLFIMRVDARWGFTQAIILDAIYESLISVFLCCSCSN